jgi:hypothetical protein
MTFPCDGLEMKRISILNLRFKVFCFTLGETNERVLVVKIKKFFTQGETTNSVRGVGVKDIFHPE